MKKFLLLSVLLILGRSYDIYATYLYIPDLKNETNLLVKYLGFGWTETLIFQSIAVAVLIVCLYIAIFKRVTITKHLPNPTLKQFIGLYYFNDENAFGKLLYKLPKNKYSAVSSLGYIGTMTLITVSFLVGMSTTMLILSKDYVKVYREYNLPVVLYGLIVVLAVVYGRVFFVGERGRYLTRNAVVNA